MKSPSDNQSEPKNWGYIDKRDRADEYGIWLGVEPCYSEEQGRARAAELEKEDPNYEYVAEPFLELPVWIN
jgi:hypothetical protein